MTRDDLESLVTELNAGERARLSRLGEITLEEMREVHRSLDQLNTIPNLLEKESE